MKYVHDSCSIECNAAKIISRKILRSSFMEIKSIGKCTTYKCKMNSEAVIVKELPNKEFAIYKKDSYLNAGDMLECQDLFLAVNTARTLKIDVVNHSGSHKAQQTVTQSFTFAQISRQIPNLPKVIEIPKLPPTGS